MDEYSTILKALNDSLNIKINQLLFELEEKDIKEFERCLHLSELYIILLFYINTYNGCDKEEVRDHIKPAIEYYSKKVVKALSDSQE